MTKIAVLGAGTWGFCLASLLGGKGFSVNLWARNPDKAARLQDSRQHPRLSGHILPESVQAGADLEAAVEGVEMVVESVTSAGFRPLVQRLKALGASYNSLVITSKGIEQDTGLLLCEVGLEIFGEEARQWLACLSGPSHAEEVISGLPTSVVGAAFEADTANRICEAFLTPTFRVYPNLDMKGVSFGGATKNIMAIACGISDGLGFGDNTKATLMTRGLHEMRKLSVVKGCRPETLYGLAGMGDLCVTCLSPFSRNYRFGRLIAEGKSVEEARGEVGMVVEGAYTCLSALQLSREAKIPLPITEAVYEILYKGMPPSQAVQALMQRPIKEEYL